MAGRPRLPTAVKELSGAYEKNPNRRPQNEPEPPAGRPEPPEDLTEEGLLEWHRTVDVLEEMRILTLADRAIVENYCKIYERRQQAFRDIKEHGLTIENKGSTVKNPSVTVFENAAAQVRYHLSELGLTPASRSKVAAISTARDEEAEDWAKVLRIAKRG